MKPTLIKTLSLGFTLLMIIPCVTACERDLLREENDYRTSMEQMHLNKNTRQFIRTYIRANIEELDLIKQKSRSPFAITDSIFNQYELPIQLKYLAVIESDLKTKAVSRVGAAGPWQLMPETARLLGLKISAKKDERKLYGKSTDAAARYLKDLHAEFGNWLLVFAAYNGGEAAVYHAIHRAGSHNYWQLQSYLPAESRGYVKRFIATLYFFEGQSSLKQFCMGS
ncbi:MAG TPA: lytic transglycosylase domain-containing protein [Puia sp.]|nr:lytic transglycosylase domain-containing protein [Puia sp.]